MIRPGRNLGDQFNGTSYLGVHLVKVLDIMSIY
jgi:hypothetical protein